MSNPLDDAIKNINATVEMNERIAGVNLPPSAERIGVQNYEVDNPEIKATLRSISEKIGSALPPGKKWGFMLMLFEYGPNGANFYASSADRDDTLAVMKEWIAKQG